MPDAFATIQAALDSGVDTVLVRAGTYSEVPALVRQVALLGLPEEPEKPVLAGLWLGATSGSFPTMRAGGIRFAGPIQIVNNDILSNISLERCELMAGMSDISAFPSTANIALTSCRVERDASLKADGYCNIDSCTFSGQLVVGQENCNLSVTNSEFHGSGSGVAISGSLMSAAITANLIEGYTSGIGTTTILDVRMNSNHISNCVGSGISVRGDYLVAENNRVERCGDYGIDATGNYGLSVAHNMVSDCLGFGILAQGDFDYSVDGNVVWNNTRDGIIIGGSAGTLTEVKRNTSCLNGGSGFRSVCYLNRGRYELEGNVGFYNGGFGITWEVPEVSAVGCNDWFGNAAGALDGLPPSSDDFTADPAFCNAANGDFGLVQGSPLADRAGCGQVGALGVGCAATATTVTRFSAERVTDGVRIVWELSQASVAQVWLERSEASEGSAWVRPETERTNQGRAVVELDHSAAPQEAYRYRLVEGDSGTTTVLGAAILVAPLAEAAFRLARVGPNPSRGPVQIEFELGHPAAIALDIFDVQGRLVASPGRGVWPLGRHVVEWPSGAERSATPGGVYLVRYRYPGGEERRRLIRTP